MAKISQNCVKSWFSWVWTNQNTVTIDVPIEYPVIPIVKTKHFSLTM